MAEIVIPIGFEAGINTRKAPLMLEDNELQSCKGFNYEHDGKLVCRNTKASVNLAPLDSIHSIERYMNIVSCGNGKNVHYKWDLDGHCKYYNKVPNSWISQVTATGIWAGICWSPELELFCAVGTDSVMTSPDGIVWTSRTPAADGNWAGICWSPELELFCAVNSGGASDTYSVMTSSDGITWTGREGLANDFYSVCWSPELGIFCAIADAEFTDQVMTSPDGITWTGRSSAEGNQWISICWSPELNLFVVISQDGTHRIMTSPDGITWTARNAAENNLLRGVCWSPELKLFCIVSYDGTHRVQTSSDGITWTARMAAAANQWLSVTWSPELGIFCAVSYNGTNRVMTSLDGITWKSQLVYASYWMSICWSPKLMKFCAISSVNYSLTSTDDFSWITRVNSASNLWFSVCWSPELELFCAVGASGTGNRVMTSPNGIDWTTRTSAEDNSWVSVCWSPDLGLFCAVSYDGTNRVMTSPDGVTWTARAAAEANQWMSVCWSPSLTLFVAVAIDGTNRVMTSADGITWAARAAAAANEWRSVCWSPDLSLFVAVSTSGTDNRVMTSANGTTWTSRTSAANNNWRGVCWSPELSLFCAVAISGTGNRVMTSPNGINWTIRTSAADNQWYSVAWSPELEWFVAVAIDGTNNRIMISKDGINWKSQNPPEDNNWISVCWSPKLRMFCSVAYTGSKNRVMTTYNKNDFIKLDTIESKERWSVANYAKWSFFVNGRDAKAMTKGKLYDWGIPNPVSAPSGAAGAAGNPDGTYTLYYTYYVMFPNGEAYETGPSPSGTVTVSDQAISWSRIASSTYSGEGAIIWRRLYRTVSGTAYRVTTIKDNTTTTYTDDVADSTLDDNTSLSTTSYDQPPAGMTQLETYLERVWGIAGNTLYPSVAYIPFLFDPGASLVVTSEGETLKAIKKWGDQLYIPSTITWYRLQGNDPDTWGIKRTFADAGVINGHTTKVTKYGILGLWYDGIYSFDGSVSRNITQEKIGRTLFTNDITDFNACFAEWDGLNYKFYYPTAGSTITNCLVIDFTHYPTLRFYHDDFLATARSFYSPTGKKYLGKADGYQYEEKDEDETISTELKSGGGHGKAIFQRKNLKYLWYDIFTNEKDVTVSFYIDDVLQDHTITLNNSARTRKRTSALPQSMEGYSFNIKLSCSDSKGIEIYSPWALMATPAGI